MNKALKIMDHHSPSPNGYLTDFNSHLFSPLGMEKPDGYFSSHTSGGHPCGGKKFFDYHPDTIQNPYTGEVRTIEQPKMVLNGLNLKKEVGQQFEVIPVNPVTLLYDYLSNPDEIYKKNRLYDINKIYEEMKELIEEVSLHKNKTEKSIKKILKKKSKQKVKRFTEKMDFDVDELAFLWNLWLLLVLTNPQIDRKFEFLNNFLFFNEGKS